MGILSKPQNMGPAAIILAVSSVLSRLMGLIRDKVISWQFGAGSEADMYFAAFAIPDMINYLLAGGFMSITIIPLLSRRFNEDSADAWRFFSCVFWWMFLASSVLTLAGMVWAPELAKLVAPGFTPQQQLRLAFFMRIILPAQVFFLVGACVSALLYLRRQFRVPALTPLIYNGSIITMGLLLPLLATFVRSGDYAQMLEELGMTGYCVGVTLGAALGAFFLPLRVAKEGGLQLHFRLQHPLMGKFLLIALPLMLGQTVIMLDAQFMRVFGSMVGEGAVSMLNYARSLAQAPVGLVGQATAVASYPFLVALLAKGEQTAFQQTLRTAMAGGLGLILPCTICMSALAWPVLGVIFQGGRFGLTETLATIPLTQILLLFTPLWLVYMVLVRAYYACSDTLTPAITGTIMTLVCLPIYYFWAVPNGAAAIALVSGASVTFYVLWLMLIWTKRHGGQVWQGLGSLTVRVLACSLPGALAAHWLGTYCMENLTLPSFLTACLALCVGGLLFVAFFLPLSWRFAPSVLDVLWKRLGLAHAK